MTGSIEVIGDATPEQVAALVAVLSAASGGAVEQAAPGPASQWSAPARLVRRTPAPGTRAANTWARSLRP